METKSVEMTINKLTGRRYSEISGQISADSLPSNPDPHTLYIVPG